MVWYGMVWYGMVWRGRFIFVNPIFMYQRTLARAAFVDGRLRVHGRDCVFKRNKPAVGFAAVAHKTAVELDHTGLRSCKVAPVFGACNGMAADTNKWWHRSSAED